MTNFCRLRDSVDSFHCGNCSRNYGDMRAFRKHVLAVHPIFMPVSPCKSSPFIEYAPLPFPSISIPSTSSDQLPGSEGAFDVRDEPASPSVTDVQQFLKKELIKAISGFHSNTGMTEKTVQGFVQMFFTYQQEVLFVGLQRLVSAFAGMNKNCSCLIDFVEQVQKVVDTAFSAVRTKEVRLKLFQSLGTLIMPEVVEVGRIVKRWRRNEPPSLGAATSQVVPLRRVLAALLSIPGLMEEMDHFIANDQCLKPNSNFKVGWLKEVRAQSLCDPSVKWYPINVYYDDFEPCNPLGSRAGIHKMGGLYVSLPCLPPRFASQLQFILLLMLVRSRDRDQFGNAAVFKRPIEELTFLHDEGVEVKVKGVSVRVKFALGLILGDNLGLNTILGFVQSFSARFCCRFCKADYKTAPFIENGVHLRSMDSYITDLAEGNESMTGIKERCVWLDLPGFDLFNNVVVDYMHDFLEGVGSYVMSCVIGGLLKENCFSLPQLNMRIMEFEYGADSDNAGVAVKMSGGGKMSKISATEMRILITYFGLLIGHMIDQYDDSQLVREFRRRIEETIPKKRRRPDRCYVYYKLYLQLRKVMDLIGSDVVSVGNAQVMAAEIETLLTMYLPLSEKPHLPPKFHFLTHYPSMLLKHGPLFPLSCIRFEGKHKPFKAALKAITCHKNTVLSAAKKMQLQLNALLLWDQVPPKEYVPGKLFPTLRSTLTPLLTFFALEEDRDLQQVKYITSPNHITYRPGQILITEFDDPDPSFVLVKKLFFDPSTGKPFVEGEQLVTVGFSNHFYAYVVHHSGITTYLQLDSLTDYPFPNTLTLGFDGNYYVTCRNSL